MTIPTIRRACARKCLRMELPHCADRTAVWRKSPAPAARRQCGRAKRVSQPSSESYLEQQVSLASARAAFQRLLAAADPLTPDSFLHLDDSTLKAIGFSRQKTGYGRNLSRAIVEGSLDIASLGRLDDESVRSELTRIKGIGRWTADIFLLMALRRPDIWPQGDLALAVAIQHLKKFNCTSTLPGKSMT